MSKLLLKYGVFLLLLFLLVKFINFKAVAVISQKSKEIDSLVCICKDQDQKIKRLESEIIRKSTVFYKKEEGYKRTIHILTH